MGKSRKRGAETSVVSMVMTKEDVRRRFELLRRWDFVCIVCGHGFDDISSVTLEHLVPRSRGGVGLQDNKAPTHHSCNAIRGNLSLVEAARIVGRRRRVMGHRDFQRWLQSPVPNRIVPPEVWRPTRVPTSLEPPEHLPGVP